MDLFYACMIVIFFIVLLYQYDKLKELTASEYIVCFFYAIMWPVTLLQLICLLMINCILNKPNNK